MKIFNNKFWLPILLVVLIAVNWLASVYHARLDLTNEKRFTLSSPVKKVLRKIEEPVTIEVFLQGNLRSGFRQLSASVNDILGEFREIAGSKIRYRFVSPDETMTGTDIKYEDTLAGLDLHPINVTSQLKEGQQQQLVYPFALVHAGDKTEAVELFKGKTPFPNFSEISSAEALLEYRFAEAISKITRKEVPLVGYAIGNGEPGNASSYDLAKNVVNKDYGLAAISLSDSNFIPQQMKALIIVKPSVSFTDLEKLKLDQYVMNGGHLLMFIDRLNAEMDSLRIKNQVIAFDRDLKLNDLLFNYGVRINADLIMDLQCDYLPFDVNGNGQFEMLPWNYFPLMESKNDHPINKGLGFVAGKFMNSIDTVEAEGIKKTVILSSSANARTIGSPAVISGAENVDAPVNEKYNKHNIPAAVLLEGKFRSLFANRLTEALRDSLTISNKSFTPACVADNKMIIVSDGDMVLSSVVKGSPIPMGMNPYTYGTEREFPFANRDFLKNCLDYLVDEDDLSEAKAKDYTPRVLDIKKVAAEISFWRAINIGLPIALVLILAVIFSFLRKRKYSKRS